MNEPLVIFVGWDEREQEAWGVCRASLLRHASVPLHIVKLDQAALRRAGWYRREWRYVEGQKIDQGDLRPFSTDFAFSRFFVPALSLYQGWALFCDCDFLFTRDIATVFDLADDKYAAMCVKHNHVPTEGVKMDGKSQGRYHRKNWSSLCLWNNAHPSNAAMTGYGVNEWPGGFLHAFSWLRDEEIGEIPPTWNWLAGVNEPLKETPAGIHFTLGVPTMPGCQKTPYAPLWRSVRASLEARPAAA